MSYFISLNTLLSENIAYIESLKHFAFVFVFLQDYGHRFAIRTIMVHLIPFNKCFHFSPLKGGFLFVYSCIRFNKTMEDGEDDNKRRTQRKTKTTKNTGQWSHHRTPNEHIL